MIIQSTESLWANLLRSLAGELPKMTYNAWVADSEMEIDADGTYWIIARDQFVKEWLHSKLRQMIRRNLLRLTGRNVQLHFRVKI